LERHADPLAGKRWPGTGARRGQDAVAHARSFFMGANSIVTPLGSGTATRSSPTWPSALYSRCAGKLRQEFDRRAPGEGLGFTTLPQRGAGPASRPIRSNERRPRTRAESPPGSSNSDRHPWCALPAKRVFRGDPTATGSKRRASLGNKRRATTDKLGIRAPGRRPRLPRSAGPRHPGDSTRGRNRRSAVAGRAPRPQSPDGKRMTHT
jgi:hypothetical protein